jgi:hypothetical protein
VNVSSLLRPRATCGSSTIGASPPTEAEDAQMRPDRRAEAARQLLVVGAGEVARR